MENVFDLFIQDTFEVPDGMSVETFVQKFGYDENGNARAFEKVEEAVNEYNARRCEQILEPISV
jgi:hypothetical protein